MWPRGNPVPLAADAFRISRGRGELGFAARITAGRRILACTLSSKCCILKTRSRQSNKLKVIFLPISSIRQFKLKNFSSLSPLNLSGSIASISTLIHRSECENKFFLIDPKPISCFRLKQNRQHTVLFDKRIGPRY